MKKTVYSFLSVLAVSSLAAASPEAASTTEHATHKATETATKVTTTTTSTSTHAKVVSVDEATKTITVTETTKGADGAESTKETKITWNETTKLMFHNPATTAAATKMPAATVKDLKAGSEVMIKLGNGNVATEISINQPTTESAKPATEMGKPATDKPVTK